MPSVISTDAGDEADMVSLLLFSYAESKPNLYVNVKQ